MRPSALLFLAVLAACAAAWALAVLPLCREGGELADRIAREDVEGRSAADGEPGPDAATARRIEEALARLHPPAPVPAPRGLAEDSPGSFAGRLPWDEVQGVLAWAAEQPRPVLEIEIRSVPEDLSRAACRVVLGQ